MATLVINTSLNMSAGFGISPDFGNPNNFNSVQTPTEFVAHIIDGTVYTFTGTGFTYDADQNVLTGTFTGISEASGGVTNYTLTNASVPVSTASSMAASGNVLGLDALLMQGNDSTSAGNGNETIIAYGANNTISAGNGNDFIHGRAGNDVIMLGSGNDTVNAALANITESGGNYQINGNSGSNSITIGGSGNNTVHGGNGAVIDNGSGNNLLYALQVGSHSITAGSGNDTITVRDGIHVAANATTITVNNFTSGHGEIALSQSAGEGLFNSANLASSIASHISGNTFTAGHLTIDFVGHTPVAADFILVA